MCYLAGCSVQLSTIGFYYRPRANPAHAHDMHAAEVLDVVIKHGLDIEINPREHILLCLCGQRYPPGGGSGSRTRTSFQAPSDFQGRVLLL